MEDVKQSVLVVERSGSERFGVTPDELENRKAFVQECEDEVKVSIPSRCRVTQQSLRSNLVLNNLSSFLQRRFDCTGTLQSREGLSTRRPKRCWWTLDSVNIDMNEDEDANRSFRARATTGTYLASVFNLLSPRLFVPPCSHSRKTFLLSLL